jgi:polysaccharide biosynthesis/export protein
MMLHMFPRAIRGVAAILTAGLMLGCATGTYPPAPQSVDTSAYTYIIGAGDSVNIIVWRNPELSMSVPVRPDGKMSAPLVEEVVAQGKTPVQLARDIERVLSTYVRDPIVVGAAARPQALPYKNKMTLLDVMIAVGGLTDFAAGNSATILRTSEGNAQYTLRIRDLIRGGDVSANVEMKPGDILIIPQSYF